MHGTDMQMRLCIVKLGVVSSRFRGGVEMHARTHNLPLTRIYKGFLHRFWHTRGFIKSENFCVYAESSFSAYVLF